MGQGTQLGEQQRSTLLVGQASEVAEHRLEILALLDARRDGKAFGGRLGDGVERRGLAAGAQDGEAAVAGDGIEPGPQCDGLGSGEELAVRGDHDVLQDVLGFLAGADHVAAEGEQLAVVAVVDDLEGGFVTGADTRGEPLVGSGAADCEPSPRRGLGRGSDRHTQMMPNGRKTVHRSCVEWSCASTPHRTRVGARRLVGWRVGGAQPTRIVRTGAESPESSFEPLSAAGAGALVWSPEVSAWVGAGAGPVSVAGAGSAGASAGAVSTGAAGGSGVTGAASVGGASAGGSAGGAS